MGLAPCVCKANTSKTEPLPHPLSWLLNSFNGLSKLGGLPDILDPRRDLQCWDLHGDSSGSRSFRRLTYNTNCNDPYWPENLDQYVFWLGQVMTLSKTGFFRNLPRPRDSSPCERETKQFVRFRRKSPVSPVSQALVWSRLTPGPWLPHMPTSLNEALQQQAVWGCTISRAWRWCCVTVCHLVLRGSITKR